MKSELGLIGLGVMGKSLSRNLVRRGFKLSLYNRYVEGKEEKVAERFIAEYPLLKNTEGYEDLAGFVASLEQPRNIFLMVNAGAAVDAVISELLPHLDPGDLIIDGGNSHYQDTERRTRELIGHQIQYIGAGVSGGEEGALKGPAIMPGGSVEAYAQCGRFLEAIAASDAQNQPCCAFIGKGGAGHFVKMVHNGIEYAEMQLLAEVYTLLRFGAQRTPEQIAEVLESWVRTDRGSYLLEITIDILRKKEGEQWLIDLILDKAGNKGTGSWTTIAAAELGVPIPSITSALFARYISAFKAERENAAKIYHYHPRPLLEDYVIQEMAIAFDVARIVNHHQGFHLLATASEVFNWELNLAEVARVWTNGCIIRSRLMLTLVKVLKDDDRVLQNRLIHKIVEDGMNDLSRVVSEGMRLQIPMPCFAATYNYLLSYTQAQSSANMIQAQRDFFGAHTYQRVDDDSGAFYHTEWK